MFTIETVRYDDPDAPAAFARSLRETGFAVLAGHPIGPERIEAAYAAWAAFFASPDKARFTRAPGSPEGFYPFASENAKGSPHKDLKEFFQVYPDTALPEEVAGVTRALYDDLVAMGLTLLSWIEAETPADVRARFRDPLPAMLRGSAMNMLRILHYPALDTPPEDGATRAAAHEDINLITLLVAGSAPGLEARDREGAWHPVPCDPGMIVVNVGDMLALASGGHYPSTTHRVVNPDPAANRSRYSMPMFIHPRPEVELAPGRTADDYLKERLREIGLA